MKLYINHGDMTGLFSYIESSCKTTYRPSEHRESLIGLACSIMASRGMTQLLIKTLERYPTFNLKPVIIQALNHGHWKTVFILSELRTKVVTLDDHVVVALKHQVNDTPKYVKWMMRRRNRERLSSATSQMLLNIYLLSVNMNLTYNDLDEIAHTGILSKRELDDIFVKIMIRPLYSDEGNMMRVAWVLDHGGGDVKLMDVARRNGVKEMESVLKHARKPEVKERLVAALLAHELEKTNM
jgi:hypothetical protein